MQFVKTPIAPLDELFLFDLYASTRQEEMSLVPWDEEQKKAFLYQQFQAQHNFYQSKFPAADYSVIAINGEKIGRLYTLETEDEIRIMDITIAPEHRNRGFGTYLIEEIVETAKNNQKSVQIFLEKNSRSKTLFSRFGFVPKDVDDVYQLWQLEFIRPTDAEIASEINIKQAGK